MRLIDADALIDDLRARKEYYASFGFNHKILAGLNDAIARIEEQPTIEERKTGKWTPKENRPKQEVFICSECGGWAYSPWIGSRKTPKPNKCKYSYCPNCGADMRGEQE